MNSIWDSELTTIVWRLLKVAHSHPPLQVKGILG